MLLVWLCLGGSKAGAIVQEVVEGMVVGNFIAAVGSGERGEALIAVAWVGMGFSRRKRSCCRSITVGR